MKSIKIAILLSALMIFFSACGNGGGAEFAGQEEVAMVIGETLEVQSGDEIVPEDAQTNIKLTHEYGNPIKKVTLLSGSATLIKGNYEVSN